MAFEIRTGVFTLNSSRDINFNEGLKRTHA